MALARNTTEIIIVRRQMFEYQGHESSNVFSSFKTAITNRYLWVLYLPTTERCFKDFLYVVAYYLIPSYQLYHPILRNIIYIFISCRYMISRLWDIIIRCAYYIANWKYVYKKGRIKGDRSCRRRVCRKQFISKTINFKHISYIYVLHLCLIFLRDVLDSFTCVCIT